MVEKFPQHNPFQDYEKNGLICERCSWPGSPLKSLGLSVSLNWAHPQIRPSFRRQKTASNTHPDLIVTGDCWVFQILMMFTLKSTAKLPTAPVRAKAGPKQNTLEKCHSIKALGLLHVAMKITDMQRRGKTYGFLRWDIAYPLAGKG